MTQILDKIVALQAAVDELAAARQRLEGIPDWMRELHEEHSTRKAEIDALEEEARAAEREKREAEAEIADNDTKLKKYQEQLNQVTTQREYGALLTEIDTAKTRISELEMVSQAAQQQAEEAREALEENQADFQELDQRYSAEVSKWESEKPAVAAQAKELESTIEELREEIPRPLLSQYDRISKRHEGSALAALLDREGRKRNSPRQWHCGACNFHIRPQVVVEVHRNDSLTLCDSCKHILYIPKSEDEDGEEE